MTKTKLTGDLVISNQEKKKFLFTVYGQVLDKLWGVSFVFNSYTCTILGWDVIISTVRQALLDFPDYS